MYVEYSVDLVPPNLIPAKFAGAKKITFFVSSLGDKIEEKIQEFSNNNHILEATLLDSWASESLEALNDAFDAIV